MYIHTCTCRYRFHEVMALRALMRAVPSLRDNGDDVYVHVCTLQDLIWITDISG